MLDYAVADVVLMIYYYAVTLSMPFSLRRLRCLLMLPPLLPLLAMLPARMRFFPRLSFTHIARRATYERAMFITLTPVITLPPR